jgi:hypothetical protein
MHAPPHHFAVASFNSIVRCEEVDSFLCKWRNTCIRCCCCSISTITFEGLAFFITFSLSLLFLPPPPRHGAVVSFISSSSCSNRAHTHDSGVEAKKYTQTHNAATFSGGEIHEEVNGKN